MNDPIYKHPWRTIFAAILFLASVSAGLWTMNRYGSGSFGVLIALTALLISWCILAATRNLRWPRL